MAWFHKTVKCANKTSIAPGSRAKGGTLWPCSVPGSDLQCERIQVLPPGKKLSTPLISVKTVQFQDIPTHCLSSMLDPSREDGKSWFTFLGCIHDFQLKSFSWELYGWDLSEAGESPHMSSSQRTSAQTLPWLMALWGRILGRAAVIERYPPCLTAIVFIGTAARNFKRTLGLAYSLMVFPHRKRKWKGSLDPHTCPLLSLQAICM